MNGVKLAMQDAGREANYSTCVRRHVGAVLLDLEGTQRGRGHNTEEDGQSCAGDCPRAALSYAQCAAGTDYGNCIVIHAEMVALWQVLVTHELREVRGWTMVVTCEPCADCAEVLERHGLHVVFGEKLQNVSLCEEEES